MAPGEPMNDEQRIAAAEQRLEATLAETLETLQETAELAGDVGRADPSSGSTLVPVPAVDHARERLEDPRRSDVDEWGRSEHMRELARKLYEPVYSKWFRAEWEGLEHIPTEGGALLVANHAAAIPSDAPVIMHGIETELGRPVYGLADHLFKSLPVIGVYWSRLGGVVAHPDNAYRLLREQQQLVLVFPEGSKGPAKHYSQRYRLRRFGRGGFVEIAMRAGVPVVPIAVVGAEESMPIVWKSATLAKALGIPYFPITANQLLLGPVLGTVGYFPAKFRLRVLPPVHFDVPPDQDRYSRSRVMEESEQIRELIQAALYDMLRKRRSVWFG
ncbi:lysophospholipid acyltransferase family protein [Rhabdothermincola sp.]|uniref:lysophospholipid acyltransferase family protein n=1 Tax=Rhabdothermincola sp. TaxID=2820405 RepID=UPI002FE1E335